MTVTMKVSVAELREALELACDIALGKTYARRDYIELLRKRASAPLRPEASL